MKHVGKLCLCLAGGLLFNAGLRAADPASSDNPYTANAARNVFDIHTPPPVDMNKPPDVPPPKITLNGITSTLGQVRALFKVAIPAKPGQPAKDQFYILGEGEAQDDIEVTKIDEKGGLVTFNNHGTDQELPLTTATASTAPAPAAAGPAAGPGPGIRPGFPRPGFPPAGGGNANSPGFIRFGASSAIGGQSPNGNTANNGRVNPSSGLGVTMGGVNGISRPQQQQPQLSGDDQAVVIAANHAIAVAKGDITAPIYPPTDYDRDAGVPSNVAPPSSPGGTPQP